jgi:hypothetical protein
MPIWADNCLFRLLFSGTVAPKLEGSEGAQYSAKSRQLLWTVPVVDAQSSSGNLEFSLPGGADPASFFPVAVCKCSLITLLCDDAGRSRLRPTPPYVPLRSCKLCLSPAVHPPSLLCASNLLSSRMRFEPTNQIVFFLRAPPPGLPSNG